MAVPVRFPLKRVSIGVSLRGVPAHDADRLMPHRASAAASAAVAEHHRESQLLSRLHRVAAHLHHSVRAALAPVALLPHACRPSAAVLTRGSGDRESLETSPWMADTVLPVSRALVRREWPLRGPQDRTWGSEAAQRKRCSPTSPVERGVGVCWGCRSLGSGLTGTLPTELGTLTALTYLCVRNPHPPRLDACAVIRLWAERGGDVGCAGI